MKAFENWRLIGAGPTSDALFYLGYLNKTNNRQVLMPSNEAQV